MESINDHPSTSITYSSSHSSSTPPDLRLLHYNDVYHIEAGSAEPVGGIPRFQTVVNHYRSDSQYEDLPKLVTLFSGDAYNPSLESSVTKGRHMVPILNNIGTDVACMGVSMDPISFWTLANVLGKRITKMPARTMTSILEFPSLGILPLNANFPGFSPTSSIPL